MTDKTQPEALRLADALHGAVQMYPQTSEDEPGGYCTEQDQLMDDAATALCVQHTRIVELEAELEAVGAGGVQALSAAPADVEDAIAWLVTWKGGEHTYAHAHASELPAVTQARVMGGTVTPCVAALAASPTPPAEQPTPNTGHAEADRLIGRLMSSDPDFEDCWHAAALIQREIKGPDGFGTWREAAIAERLARVNQQAAPKAAPESFLDGADVQDESGVLAYYSREAVLACINAALESVAAPKAAPQQEAQEPTAISEAIERMAADRYKVVPSHESMFHRWAVVAGTGTQQLYLGREVECQNMARKFAGAFLDGAFVAMQQAAPQPAPAPLSDDVVKDAAFEAVRKKLCALPRYSFVLDDDGVVRRAPDRTGNWIEFDEAHALFDPVSVDAALAAQGGK